MHHVLPCIACSSHSRTCASVNDRRSRIEYNTDDMTLTTTTIHKEPVLNVDLRSSDESEYDVRVSCKRETPYRGELGAVRPKYVRIKQQRRFVTDSGWAFDFTMSWGDTTKDGAEKKQMHSDPQLEIECELLDPTKLANREEEMVASLLLKMKDFLGKHTQLRLM